MPRTAARELVNENGTPMVLYHGTGGEFNEFKHSEIRAREGSFFFVQNKDDAAGYAGNGNVMEVYVSLQNPIDYNDMPSEIYNRQNKREQLEALKRLGYDGWYADMDTGWGEVSAFYAEQIKSATDNTGTFNRGASDIRYSVSEEYQDEMDEWDAAGRPEGETFILGATGDVLQGLGAMEQDIYLHSDKVNTILREHPEMTLDEIKRIPEILDDPVLVLKSRNVKNARSQYGNNRLVLFGTVRAQDGRPVMCVMDLRPTESGFLLDDMQKLSSAYTKDNRPAEFILASDVLYLDKKRTTSLLRNIGFQMPMSLLRSGSIGSISYNGQNVNMSGIPMRDIVGDEAGERYKNMSFSSDDTAEDLEQVEKMMDDGRGENISSDEDNEMTADEYFEALIKSVEE